MKCSEMDINDALNCTKRTRHYLEDKLKRSFKELKGWLSSLLSDATTPWIVEGAIIEKKDINIAARYWFGFISSSLMPSQNESIVQHPKATLLGCIIDRESLNFVSIIALEMFMRQKQNQTSLPFLILIIFLCRKAGVPFVKKKDVDITPSSACDILRIDAEYQRDEAERKKKMLVGL